jgi:hypothetical protein
MSIKYLSIPPANADGASTAGQFHQRFLDGSIPTNSYLDQISRMLSDAINAESMFDIDDLELS